MKNSIVHVLEAESYEQRLERMNEYQDKNHKYPNVQAVRTRPEGRNTAVKEWFLGANIVTNDGDIFYAKQAAEVAPAANENFHAGRFELRSSNDTPAKADTYSAMTTPVTNSNKLFAGGYPLAGVDGDADNTGDQVDSVSYSVAYTTAEANHATIQGGCIHDNASPTAGTKLLTHFSITSFAKTSSDTLKMFVNHVMNGVP